MVHRYSKWVKPKAGLYFTLGIGVFFWFSIFAIFLNDGVFSWSDIRHGLTQFPGGYFFFCWVALIILINLLHRPGARDHVFYNNVCKIYQGARKQPYRWILPEEIEYMVWERVNYKREDFYVVTIRFKSLQPKFLGRPSNIKFGIDGCFTIENLANWAKERGVPLQQNLVKVA